MAENEAPSKTLLLERREERSLVSEGKSVLEERRDTLAQAIIANLRTLEPQLAALRATFEQACAMLRAAALRHGPQGLHRLAERESSCPSPRWRMDNYFGTRMVSVELPEVPNPVESRWDSTEDVARARVAFHRLVLDLASLAAHSNNLSRLTFEYRRTQRKVNALEHVVLPGIEESIRSIEFTLEETERENMARALNVKRRLARS